MHYAEFGADEVSKKAGPPEPLDAEAQQSLDLLNAIKEYENNKWKVIGQKVGKPAKVCFAPSIHLSIHLNLFHFNVLVLDAKTLKHWNQLLTCFCVCLVY